MGVVVTRVASGGNTAPELSSNDSLDAQDQEKIMVAASVTVLSGIIQVSPILV